MDIYELLVNPIDELYPEDLDFFEAELATGSEYSEAYKRGCMDIIYRLRRAMGLEYVEKEPYYDVCSEKTSVIWVDKNDSTSSKLVVPKMTEKIKDTTVDNQTISEEEIVRNDLIGLRETYGSDYKAHFIEYVSKKEVITVQFVDDNISIFTSDELNFMLSVIQFGEDFLEKYYNSLNPDKIARNQLFSEKFFMKHYPELKAGTVLKFGINEWRKKANMSKQLEVFLKLKGVRI